MILSCETVKCPVNLQQIPDKCWHMISSSSRPNRQIATSWEQRFLTDGFYLWLSTSHQGVWNPQSGCRQSFQCEGKWNCFLTKMQDLSCGNSSVCLEFSHGAYRRARATPFDTRGLIRVRAHSHRLPDIYKYLVSYSPAPCSPPLSPLILYWSDNSQWSEETVIRGNQ